MTSDDIAKRVVAVCGAPRRLAGLGTDKLSCHDDNYQLVVKRCRALGAQLAKGAFLEQPLFLLLMGPFGTGKSRIATWLLEQAYRGIRQAQCIRAHGHQTPLFISARNLSALRFGRRFDGFEDIEDDRERLRDRTFRCRFLVIDDVNRVAGYRGEGLFVEEVIEERWNENRSTVVTCSSEPDVLGARFRDFLSYFTPLIFTGPSRRKEGQHG